MKHTEIEQATYLEAFDLSIWSDINGGHVWDEDLVTMENEARQIIIEMAMACDQYTFNAN